MAAMEEGSHAETAHKVEPSFHFLTYTLLGVVEAL